MDKRYKSLRKVEVEMCYLEAEGKKGSPTWKNKNSYRKKLVDALWVKRKPSLT